MPDYEDAPYSDATMDSASESASESAIDTAIDGAVDALADSAVDAVTDTEDSAPETFDAGTTGPKRVFVSSALYNGDLGGLSGADAKCQTLATAALLTGTYKAWLSDATTSATTRLTHSIEKYVLVDGTTVATSWAQLASGSLSRAIDRTELGTAPAITTASCGGGPRPTVWTGTNTTGVLGGSHCLGWASTSGGGAVLGWATEKTSAWTQWCTASGSAVCTWTSALYCIEQ